MIVYRFEKNGIGPYVSRTQPPNGSFYRKVSKTRTERKYNAKFQEKMKEVDTEDRERKWYKSHSDMSYMYGCSSKEALRIYFGGNFKPLFKQGFRIKRYNVPDDQVIDMQIEVAFPVRYHKFQTLRRVREAAFAK